MLPSPRSSKSLFGMKEHFAGVLIHAGHCSLYDGRKARAKLREKRGGGLNRLDVNEVDPADDSNPEQVFAINDALKHLAAEDERLAALVKLRCFAGFTLVEAAEAMGVARSTAIEDWAYAKSRLRILLGGPSPT